MDYVKIIEYNIFKQVTTPGHESYVKILLRDMHRVREYQGGLNLAMHKLQFIYKMWYTLFL